MSATLQRRPVLSRPAEHAPGPAPAPRPARQAPAVPDDVLALGLVLLVLVALLPFQRIYIGSEWIRPVVGSALLALGIGWGARRLGVGPLTHLAMTSLGLLVFITIAFLPTTALWGLLPTTTTLTALRDLFVRGLELVELRPSPTFAEAGLLLLTVSGVWVISYLADGMLFVLRSSTKAVVAVLCLWAVPLAVAPPGESILRPAAAMLLAAGVLLLLGNTQITAAYGVAVSADAAPGDAGQRAVRVPTSGWLLLGAATLAGVLLAGALPGYGARPVYQVRGASGTTITTNPIVNIQERLVAQDTGPVLRVASPRPVYLRTTALNTYNEREEWGLDGTIGGDRVSGTVDQPPPIPTEEVRVDVVIEGIEGGAILAPTPYQTVAVEGGRAGDMRYDRRSATLTVPGDQPLVRGDGYQVVAAIPQPPVEALRAVPKPVGDLNTALPPDVPQLARDLATEIVTTAGATTMFDQALAIQDRLRTWQYATQPQFGDGDTFLEQFINGQQGYCEQFAGTMAVLLRTLGIPSRLAVGYTPGTQGADGLWVVTNANAHAWVEVDFGPLGWISFEPTPRTDGNVLVPNSSAVVPQQTVAMQAGGGFQEGPGGPGEIPQAQPTLDPRLLEGELPPTEAAPLGGPQGSSGSSRVPLGIVLGLLAVVGLGAFRLRRQGHAHPHRPPGQRIELARRRAERAGAAVGRGRRPWETDVEYFSRLSDGHRLGDALAGSATRADYAPSVTVEDAETAEAAAESLRGRLVAAATPTARARLAATDLLDRRTPP